MVCFCWAIFHVEPAQRSGSEATVEGVSEGVVQMFDARLQNVALFGLLD